MDMEDNPGLGWTAQLDEHAERIHEPCGQLLSVYMWIARLGIPGVPHDRYLSPPYTYPDAAAFVRAAFGVIENSRRELLDHGVPEERVNSTEFKVWFGLPIRACVARIQEQRERDRANPDYGPRLLRECDTAKQLVSNAPLDMSAEKVCELLALHESMEPDGTFASPRH